MLAAANTCGVSPPTFSPVLASELHPALVAPPGLVALWPLRFRERSPVCGRRSLQGFYRRDPGGLAPGLSADGGLWKEEERGPGCLNSWAGLLAAIPAPASGLGSPFLPGVGLWSGQVPELSGGRAFSALRQADC